VAVSGRGGQGRGGGGVAVLVRQGHRRCLAPAAPRNAVLFRCVHQAVDAEDDEEADGHEEEAPRELCEHLPAVVLLLQLLEDDVELGVSGGQEAHEAHEEEDAGGEAGRAGQQAGAGGGPHQPAQAGPAEVVQEHRGAAGGGGGAEDDGHPHQLEVQRAERHLEVGFWSRGLYADGGVVWVLESRRFVLCV